MKKKKLNLIFKKKKKLKKRELIIKVKKKIKMGYYPKLVIQRMDINKKANCQGKEISILFQKMIKVKKIIQINQENR